MNSRRKLILILVAAVVGLSSGFAFRWIQHAPKDTAATARSAPASSDAKEQDHNGNGAARKREISGPVARLEEGLTMSNSVTRWLHWMTAVEEAKLADFPRLARMAHGNPIALRMVGARWIELNPRHLFDTLERAAREDADSSGAKFPANELANLLFSDWAKRDPDAAIEALSSADARSSRNWRFSVVNGVMEVDPERGLKTMSEWRLENYGPGTKGITKWAEKNPRHAAEFALAHPAGYATQTAMDVIGKVWAKSDPQEALTFAAGLKDKYGASLASGIVKAWAGSDLAKAAAWLTEADPKIRGRLSGDLVEIWAKSDTSGAMNWIQDNLTGSGLDEAVGSVLKGMAEKSVTDAAGLVTGMEASQARTKAALSVARKWFPDYNSQKPADPAAVAWLSSLDPASLKHVVDHLQWQWGNADPKGFAGFLTSPAGANVSSHAFGAAAREMARQNPEQAFEWVGKLSPEHRGEAENQVYWEWTRSQPAAAMEWIRNLPAGDPRRERMFGMIAREFMPPGDSVDAFAKSLASGGEAAREAVQALPIPEERKEKLIERLQLR